MRRLIPSKELLIIALVGVIIAIQQERDERDALEDYQRFVLRHCQPRLPGDRAVIDMGADHRHRCAVYTRAGYGLMPALQTAATSNPYPRTTP